LASPQIWKCGVSSCFSLIGWIHECDPGWSVINATNTYVQNAKTCGRTGP
jgi:hypothetical protein